MGFFSRFENKMEDTFEGAADKISNAPISPVQIEKKAVQNEFDETCQGTVPVALWIISQSTDFEDAVRRAVSLGADADTLGAIVGSMAEAIWGIPPEMLEMAMRYLPPEMKKVVLEFYDRYANVSQMKYYEALRKSRFVADGFTITKPDGTVIIN